MSAIYLKLFVDCLEKYQKLNDTEFGRLVRAALRYKATGAEPDDLGREALLWDGMRLDIDRDNENYSAIVTARSEAGKKGAKARWQQDSVNAKFGKSHLPYSKNGQEKEEDKEKDKEEDKDKDRVNTRAKFAPPSLQEVTDYCRERGNGVDPERFVDFYAAKGWKVGNQPMKDWRAAVRTWEKREERIPQKPRRKSFAEIAAEMDKEGRT